MNLPLEKVVFFCGLAQFGILIASSLVPFRLDWKKELGCLSTLHRQMYWVYGGYVVLSIVAFGLISVFNAAEIASGTPLARSFAAYVSVFWGVRLLLQGIFDVKEHLTAWWLKAGYGILTVLFFVFAFSYGLVALH